VLGRPLSCLNQHTLHIRALGPRLPAAEQRYARCTSPSSFSLSLSLSRETFLGPGCALAWRVPNGYADADLRQWPAQSPLRFAGLPSSCLGFHVPPRQTPQAIVAVLPQLAQCLSSRNDLQTAETTQQGQSEDYENG
jgi:hypothetical protein